MSLLILGYHDKDYASYLVLLWAYAAVANSVVFSRDNPRSDLDTVSLAFNFEMTRKTTKHHLKE